jgi:membrane-associated protease RseP (regulator of RpoE activity)
VSDSSHEAELPPIRWKLPALFFALTVLTTFAAGVINAGEEKSGALLLAAASRGGFEPGWLFLFPALVYPFTPLSQWGEIFLLGLPYAGTVLSILLCHEFGHYLFARRYRVDTTLPYCIPMPLWIIGTMGAVIRMRSPINSRNALLDIGAAGPLAGMAVALPAMLWGVAHSPVVELPAEYSQEGISLLYAGLKYLIHGPIPAGSDIMMHPVALAAWFGFFMTALNLLPIGQLDGGHIAFAALLRGHDRVSRVFHGALFVAGLALYQLFGFSSGLSWAFFGGVIAILMRGFGPRHPPVEDPHQPLSRGRLAVAVLCLLIFILIIPPFTFEQMKR